MDLLRRAKGLIRGVAQAPFTGPQPYRVACAEGHVLTGQRTEGYQALRCPTCGEGVFVLPRSPLPEPPRPAPRKETDRSGAEADETEDADVLELTDVPLPASAPDEVEYTDIDWDAELEERRAAESAATAERDNAGPRVGEAEPKPQARPRSRAKRPEDTQERPEPAEKREPGRKPSRRRVLPSEPEPEPETAPAFRWDGERFRAWCRQHRNLLIFGGVAGLLVLTVFYRIGQSRREELPQVAELGRTEGIKALDSGSFDKAHQLLSKAKAAVIALGGAIEGADEIKQAADEAAIFANLSPESLETILDEAARMEGDRLADWFATHYAGRTIIIDATVTAVPAPGGPSRYELDYRVFHGGKGTVAGGVGRLDTTGLTLFKATQLKVGTPVRFGAKLDSLRLDQSEDVWLFGLDPASGVSMTHAKALEAFGWPVSQAPAVDVGQEAMP